MGRKRHILVDTHGSLVSVVVHPADIQDRDGAYAVLEQATAHTRRVTHLWADAAYRGAFARWVQAQWGWTITIGQRTPGVAGVHGPTAALGGGTDFRVAGPLPPVEQRTMKRTRPPAKTWIALAMCALLLRRLCPSS